MKNIILSSVLLVSASLFSIAQADPIVNGSFEMSDERNPLVPSYENPNDGGYYGWTLLDPGVDAADGTWGIAGNGITITSGINTWDYADQTSVGQISSGLPHTYTATDGTSVAYHLQKGLAVYQMYQDIIVCPQADVLTWDMEYNNHSGSFNNGHFSAVELYDFDGDGDTIEPALATLFKTVSGDSNSISMTAMIADISTFSGQTVRLMVTHRVQDYFFDAAWDNFRISGCESNALSLDADGFESPATGTIAVKKNKTLPLKVSITSEGAPVTDTDIVAAPIVQVLFDNYTGDPVVDVSAEALASGQGTEGNQFVYTDDGKWQFNLKIKNYTASGAYIVTMESGDPTEYVLAPTPTVTFVVE